MQVVETEVVHHGSHRAALHLEGWAELLVEVATRSPPGDHRVLLMGFEHPPSQQFSVFVGLEVGEADQYRPRVEGGADEADSLAQLVDEQAPLVHIRPRPALDLIHRCPDDRFILTLQLLCVRGERLGDDSCLEEFLEVLMVHQRQRMDAHLGGEHELDACQAHSIHRKLGIGE